MFEKRLSIILVMLVMFSSCVISDENPEKLFISLLDKYSTTKNETKKISNEVSEGMGLTEFDVDKKLSRDRFCLITLYSSLGQTRYYCYQKDSESIWFISKQAYFYTEPMVLEGAEIQNTYFKYSNSKNIVYDFETQSYNKVSDVDAFSAVVDVPSIKSIITILETNHK